MHTIKERQVPPLSIGSVYSKGYEADHFHSPRLRSGGLTEAVQDFCDVREMASSALQDRLWTGSRSSLGLVPAVAGGAYAPANMPPELVMHQSIHLPTAAVKRKMQPIIRSGVRISHIEAADGSQFLVSNTQLSGSFGKVRVGIDGQGEAIAVKEMRRHTSRKVFCNGRTTYPTDDLRASNEFVAMLIAHGREIARGHYLTEKSNLLVMPLLHGDLKQFAQSITGSFRYATARQQVVTYYGAAADLAAQLSHFHQHAQAVLCDIKPANILVDPNRGFFLADFGLTIPVDPLTQRTVGPAQGTVGYSAPETYLPDQAGYPADVWSLGRSLLDLLVPSQQAPFSKENNPDFSAYKSWHRRLPRGQDGVVDTTRLYTMQGRFGEYFRTVAAMDPRIACVTLAHLMHPDPAQRWSSSEFVTWATRTKAAVDHLDQWRDLLRSYAASNSPYGEVLRHIRHYRTFGQPWRS